VIVKVPTKRVDFVSFATLPLSDALPSEVLPLLKVIVPVGVGPVELTVAVNVTDWP